MKSITESILGRELLEMSNLRPADTGINGIVIWVSAGEFGGADASHGPRVKIIIGGGKVNDETLASAPSIGIKNGRVFRGEICGQLLKQVRAFIDLNQDVLLQYWDQAIGTKDMVSAIRGVK